MTIIKIAAFLLLCICAAVATAVTACALGIDIEGPSQLHRIAYFSITFVIHACVGVSFASAILGCKIWRVR